MHVVEYADPEGLSVRSHPWEGSASDPSHRYVDLKAHPGLIRTALEDFTPWAVYPAIRTFYRLLEQVNGPSSVLETNDCAFNGPSPNEMPQFDKSMQCSGRVMLLFRDLAQNQDAGKVQALAEKMARVLSEQDPEFEWGVVGVTVVPVHLRALPGPQPEQLGHQLMLSFWAWGDDPVQTLAHLDRTLRAVRVACERASELGSSPS